MDNYLWHVVPAYWLAEGFLLLIAALPWHDVRRGFLVLEQRSRSGITCTTHELNALNTRLRDAAADCLVLTEQV